MLVVPLAERLDHAIAGRLAQALDSDARFGLVLLDDGTEEDFDEEAAPRGRPLVISIARELLFPTGGRVETSREGGVTQVRLSWPAFG